MGSMGDGPWVIVVMLYHVKRFHKTQKQGSYILDAVYHPSRMHVNVFNLVVVLRLQCNALFTDMVGNGAMQWVLPWGYSPFLNSISQKKHAPILHP